MEAFEDNDEFEEDYKDGNSLHDALLRKIGMLCQKCIENERLIKRLKMELRLSKSTARQTKCQIRINYNQDGEEANFADSVLSFVKEYLFPHLKFLKDGWMDYDKGQDSFSTFVQGKVQIPEERSTRMNGRELCVQPFKQSMSLLGAISTMRFKEHTRVSSHK